MYLSPLERLKRETMAETTIKNHAAFIWSVADLLRGDYQQSEDDKVILPLTVIRRLDCVLERSNPAVLERAKVLKGQVENVDPVLENVAGQKFFNTSPLDFRRLLDDPGQIAGNLRGYMAGFSAGAREVIEKFDFDVQIAQRAWRRKDRTGPRPAFLGRRASGRPEVAASPLLVGRTCMGKAHRAFGRPRKTHSIRFSVIPTSV